jgi:DNA-binding IclR family transcriptional regulator
MESSVRIKLLDVLPQSTPPERWAPHTPADAAAVRRLLAVARKRGRTREENETDLGVMCAGAPVFDSVAEAAVGLSAPGDRVRRADWAARVRATADRTTARPGGGEED